MSDRFIDVLLSKIITEYPHHSGMSDQARLKKAREALFGKKPAKGRSRLNDDLALFYMVAENTKEDMDKLRQALGKINPEYRTAEWQKEFARTKKSLHQTAHENRHLASGFDEDGRYNYDSLIRRLRANAVNGAISNRDMAEIESIINNDGREMDFIGEILPMIKYLVSSGERLGEKEGN